MRFLYEHAGVFAVAKDAGVHSVRLARGGGDSLADALIMHNPELQLVGQLGIDGGLVSRLDFDTSGIILGATTQPVWELLRAQLLRGEVHKVYQACVEGCVREARSITTYIGSPHRGASTMRVYECDPGKRGRAMLGTSSITPVQYVAAAECSFVEVVASPARRHQVRLHLSYTGHPLLGDRRYGSHRTLPPALAVKREFILHASAVRFVHPVTAEQVALDLSLAWGDLATELVA